MSGTEIAIFTLLLLFATALFLQRMYRLLAMLCLGRWENRFDHLLTRLRCVLIDAFGQRRVLREKFGLNHVVIFWGFLALVMVNTEFLVAGVFPQFSFAFLGEILYGVLRLVADVLSLAVLAAVVVAVVRRAIFRPAHIEPTWDAFIILSLIGTLMLAYFGLNACEIRREAVDSADWLPVSQLLSRLLPDDSPAELHAAAHACWWIHALVLLFFLTYLPRGKHLHIITAIPNCFFRSLAFVNTLPRMIFQKGRRFGVSKVFQFTWKDVLDFYACTECGRCQAACPAHLTGKTLNPKEVVHAGKLNLLANGPALLTGRLDSLGPASDDAPTPTPLIGGGADRVAVDAIWACTSCGACMQVCPVYIEHVPKLIGLRRHLVMEQAEFPQELSKLFENTEQRSNPWGIAPGDRAKWAQEHEVKILADDVNVEYLFFVGCAGAFDSRSRQTAVALARIFNTAGLSWGILGTREKCCGDSLRRLGNEYVFDQLARENVALFKKHGIRKVITFCPHCFNTLKNDYQPFGADFEVLHHTQLVAELLRLGRIRVHSPTDERIVFHDSCYLGRYNRVYREPRELLTAASGGRPPLEMPRCQKNSFCCGAGGGRMWMDEDVGKPIYLERTQEALRLNPSTICVACPYCMTMFEDGLRDEQPTTPVKVKDVAEIVAQALRAK